VRWDYWVFAEFGDNEARLEIDTVVAQGTWVLENHHRVDGGFSYALHLDVNEDVTGEDRSMRLDLIAAGPV
jgi:hypothetical protein